MSHKNYGVHTQIGYGDPVSGEQLDVTKGLANPVDYYKPNAGVKSYLDPDGVVDGILLFRLHGKRATLSAHLLAHELVDSVEWDFGDGSDPVTGDTYIRHVFAQNGTYTVEATVKFTDATPDLELDTEIEVALPGAPEIDGVDPVIVGDDAAPGTPQTISLGTWTGNPTSFAVRWLLDGNPIPWATQHTYVPQDSDDGSDLTCEVFATNEYGTNSAVTVAVVIDGTPCVAPANTVAPVAAGDAEVGAVLSVTDGTWTGTETIVYSYQWQSDISGDFEDIVGADEDTYTLDAGDESAYIRCMVTATNDCGATSEPSNAVGPITQP